MNMYYIEANKEREEIDKREEDSNIKYFRDKAIEYKEYIISRSTNKMIRMINTINEKERYFKEKFTEKEDVIDL